MKTSILQLSHSFQTCTLHQSFVVLTLGLLQFWYDNILEFFFKSEIAFDRFRFVVQDGPRVLLRLALSFLQTHNKA